MMNSIRSSKGTIAAVLLAVLVGAAGTAAAISVSAEEVPDETEVGSEVSATIVVEDPFTDTPNEWQLRGQTEMRNVSWTVTVLDQGQQVSQNTYGGQSFQQDLARANGGDEVRIEVTGIAPSVENYSYDPPQSFAFATVTQRTGDNTQELGEWETHHYTNQSAAAREAIENAEDAISEAGGNDDAERSLQQAVSAYDNGIFENAISNAEDAQRAAEQAQQSQQTTQLLIYAGIGVVVLAIVVGGVWYYRQQQDTYDKLR